MKKTVFIIIGTVSLVLGILGIFLPLLPTVPFLLLTASCYMRSSGRLYNWLITHPYFGKIIVDFQQNRVIPRKTKIFTISLLWVSIGLSAFWVNLLWVRILLGVIAIGVTIHIVSYKSTPDK